MMTIATASARSPHLVTHTAVADRTFTQSAMTRDHERQTGSAITAMPITDVPPG